MRRFATEIQANETLLLPMGFAAVPTPLTLSVIAYLGLLPMVGVKHTQAEKRAAEWYCSTEAQDLPAICMSCRKGNGTSGNAVCTGTN
jgi:hypothetical protein